MAGRPLSGRPAEAPSLSALRAWAEVDLDAIAANVAVVSRLAGSALVMAVVKADGYGHGAVPVAKVALAAGARWLGTATVEEGLRLRGAGVAAPILVLGPAPGEEKAALRAGLALTVVDIEGVRAAAKAVRALSRDARVHLKVDTGMTRLGADPDAVEDIAKRAARIERVTIEGVFTHLAAADSDPAFTRDQLSRFLTAAEAVRSRFPRAIRHAAATAAILTLPDAYLDLVRLGIGMYGGYRPTGPAAAGAPAAGLRQAMSLWGRVMQVRYVQAGTTVSYGRTFTASRATGIATVALGYGDGYPRALSNIGRMLIAGQAYPVAGRVCMDYTMLDVGTGPVRPGDAALAFGPDLNPMEVAEQAGTISYELFSRVSSRIPRIYRWRGKRVEPAEDLPA